MKFWIEGEGIGPRETTEEWQVAHWAEKNAPCELFLSGDPLPDVRTKPVESGETAASIQDWIRKLVNAFEILNLRGATARDSNNSLSPLRGAVYVSE